MYYCDICGETAVTKAWGGPVKTQASTWGSDTPYEENHTFRCKKHQRSPDAPFGELWRWTGDRIWKRDYA